MAGLIQTAIGQALASVAGAAAIGKKAYEKHEGQVEQEAAETKEAEAVALEADLRNQGASDIAAKAYRLAQERGMASPERIIFDESGKPLATYSEMAEILAKQGQSNSYSGRLKGKNAVEERKKLLEGRTHEERVQNALLAAKGGK